MEGEVKRRIVDRSGADARRLVDGALTQFTGWRSDLARMTMTVERGVDADDRSSLLERCDLIEVQLMEVRTALLLDLAEAPPKVAGNNRVVDIEKALDGIAAQTAELRRRLS